MWISRYMWVSLAASAWHGREHFIRPYLQVAQRSNRRTSAVSGRCLDLAVAVMHFVLTLNYTSLGHAGTHAPVVQAVLKNETAPASSRTGNKRKRDAESRVM